MNRRIGFLGAVLVLALAWPAQAQQFSSGVPGRRPTATSSTSNMSSFFSQTMAKPSFSAMSVRPAMPGPLDVRNMLPSFPNLQSTFMLRNIFSGPQTGYQTPPPPKKK